MQKAVAEAIAKYPDYDTIIKSNLGEDYRNPQEGSLFVHRAPHEIRPQADTGVQVQFDEADQRFVVTLDYPLQQTQYEWNSIQLETEHILCVACLDVLNYYCKYSEARFTVRDSFQTTV